MHKVLKYFSLILFISTVASCGGASHSPSSLKVLPHYDFYYQEGMTCLEFDDVYLELFADIDFQPGRCPSFIPGNHDQGIKKQLCIAGCYFENWHLVKYYYKNEGHAYTNTLGDAKEDCLKAGGQFKLKAH